MKKKRIILILGVFLALAVVFYGLRMGPFQESAAKGQQKGRRGRGGRTVTVKAAEVRTGDVEERLNYVGSLMPNASVTIAPKISGRVEAVLVDVGDWVEAGQPLARLDQRELAEDVREAEASLRVYEATLGGRQAELEDLKKKQERSKTLYEKNFISRQEVDTLDSQVLSASAQVELTKAQIAQMKARLKNARIRLGDTEMVSPFAAYVGKRFVDPGALVNPGTPIVNVVDIFRVKVVTPVVEKDYPKISPGLAASISVDAYPGRRFQGKVVRMAPVLNQDTRTGEAEIEVSNPEGILKPGMFAKVEIVARRRRGALLVPEGALVKTGEGHGVFKLGKSKKGSKVKLVPVKIGLSHRGWVEVQGSLKSGDRVVTLGSSLLRDGQRVKVTKTPLGAGGKGDGV